jgi:hypothetical protein
MRVTVQPLIHCRLLLSAHHRFTCSPLYHLQSIWCFENVMELAKSKGLLTASSPVMCKPNKQVRSGSLRSLPHVCGCNTTNVGGQTR